MATTNVIVDKSRVGVGQERDYALSSTTTDLSRTIDVGSNWKRIRIGVRLGISGSYTGGVQAGTINQPQLAIGLCNSTASTYSTNTTHFVGTDLDPSQYLINHTGTDTYYWSNSSDSFNVGSGTRFVVKIGNITTVYGAAFNDGWGANVDSGSPVRTVHYTDFIKQTTGPLDTVVDPGLWLIKLQRPSPFTLDTSASVFYSQLANDTASAIVSVPIQQSVPVSESINGYLNTVNIYWSKEDPPIEISDVAVWRFM